MIDNVCIDDTSDTPAGLLVANASNISPLPAEAVTQNNAPVMDSAGNPALLFRNVIQVWKQNYTSLRPEYYSASLEDMLGAGMEVPDLGQAATTYYFVPTDATDNDSYTFNISQQQGTDLPEGYYTLQAKVNGLTNSGSRCLSCSQCMTCDDVVHVYCLLLKRANGCPAVAYFASMGERPNWRMLLPCRRLSIASSLSWLTCKAQHRCSTAMSMMFRDTQSTWGKRFSLPGLACNTKAQFRSFTTSQATW